MSSMGFDNLYISSRSITAAHSRQGCSVGLASLNPGQTAESAATKQVIYDAFKAALRAGVSRGKARSDQGLSARRIVEHMVSGVSREPRLQNERPRFRSNG